VSWITVYCSLARSPANAQHSSARRGYAGFVNARARQTGHLFQARMSRDYAALRGAEAIGRPLGAPDFIAAIARQLGRAVAPR
jgi:hypothetical protein